MKITKYLDPILVRMEGSMLLLLKVILKKTISYPKFLVECYLNKELSKEETIDHIDGDFNNNDFSNLRIVNRSQHSKDDSIKLIPLETKCPICGKKVLINSTNSYNRGKVTGFCSKKCSGFMGRWFKWVTLNRLIKN